MPPAGGSAATRSACGSGSGIAGALLADPPVLIFDEPANGLDPEGIRWMRDLLRGHAARGGTVLLSSHLLGEVEHTVDRLLVIGGGRIVADGSVAELLGADGHGRPGGAAGRPGPRPRGGRVPRATRDGRRARRARDRSVPGRRRGGRRAVTCSSSCARVQRGLEDLFFQLTTAA